MIGKWIEVNGLSEEVDAAIETLKKIRKMNLRFYPEKNALRVFREIDPPDLKAIVMGQDPYPWPAGQATGRAFECGVSTSPSWRMIAKNYIAFCKEYDFIPEENIITGKNLSVFSDNGVMLLNRSLTVEAGKPGSHMHIWSGFTTKFIEHVKQTMPYVRIYILGKMSAKGLEKYADKIYDHPVSAHYRGHTWESDLFEDLFKNNIKLHKDDNH